MINTLLEQRGVIVNQGVIAKELLPWLARAGVLAAQPRGPFRWLVTDLAAIAAALAAHPYEELTDGNHE